MHCGAGWESPRSVGRLAGNSQAGADAEVHRQNFFFFGLRVLNGLQFELNLIIGAVGNL